MPREVKLILHHRTGVSYSLSLPAVASWCLTNMEPKNTVTLNMVGELGGTMEGTGTVTLDARGDWVIRNSSPTEPKWLSDLRDLIC